MIHRISVAVLVAVAAIVVCSVAVAFSLQVQGWRVSGLVRMDSDDEIAPFARQHDRSFAFVPEGHYDGVYFYAMTTDPFARGEAHELIDHSAYRYGHVGYSWIAWLFSLGKPRLVPSALLLVGLAGAGIAGYTASRIAGHLGWSPWAGLAVALQPGLVYSTTVLTSEAVGFAVVGLGLLLWLDEREWPALALLAFASIVKEPFVLIPVGLFVWDLAQRRSDLWRRAFLLAGSCMPFVLWNAYIYRVFGETSFQDSASPLSFPFGWAKAMTEAAQMGLQSYAYTQVGTIALPILVIAFALMFVGVIRAFRLRSILDPIYILQFILVISLSGAALTYPKDFFRTIAFPLALVIPVVFSDNSTRPRAPAS